VRAAALRDGRWRLAGCTPTLRWWTRGVIFFDSVQIHCHLRLPFGFAQAGYAAPWCW